MTGRRWSSASAASSSSGCGGGGGGEKKQRQQSSNRKRRFSLPSRRRSSTGPGGRRRSSTMGGRRKSDGTTWTIDGSGGGHSHGHDAIARTQRRPAKSGLKIKTQEESLRTSYKSKRAKRRALQRIRSGRRHTHHLQAGGGGARRGDGLRKTKSANNAGAGEFRNLGRNASFSSFRNLGRASFSSFRNVRSSLLVRHRSANVGGVHADERTAAQRQSEMSGATTPPPPGVRFGTVEIRDYSSVLCDNPEVMSGPGVALDWDYSSPGPAVSLDTYERSRGPRMELHELALSKFERTKRLLANGVSREELVEAERSSYRARQKRMNTVKSIHSKTYVLEERWEGAANKFRKMVGLKKKKSREEEEGELWSRAQLYFAAY